MKKTYISPRALHICLDTESLIASTSLDSIEIKEETEEIDNPEEVWTRQQGQSIWDAWSD